MLAHTIAVMQAGSGRAAGWIRQNGQSVLAANALPSTETATGVVLTSAQRLHGMQESGKAAADAETEVPKLRRQVDTLSAQLLKHEQVPAPAAPLPMVL